MLASSSPEYIVGNHVLHRLCVPRYPPLALYSLTFFLIRGQTLIGYFWIVFILSYLAISIRLIFILLYSFQGALLKSLSAFNIITNDADANSIS